MSDVYIQRLRSIRDEYTAARDALAYVTINWNRSEIIQRLGATPKKDFERAERNLENTYFVRLFAEFEGILKDHLATNHPSLAVPNNLKIDMLIKKVVRIERLVIAPPLRQQLDLVRSHRNAIAHRGAIAMLVTFQKALASLSRFLDKLPD